MDSHRSVIITRENIYEITYIYVYFNDFTLHTKLTRVFQAFFHPEIW